MNSSTFSSSDRHYLVMLLSGIMIVALIFSLCSEILIRTEFVAHDFLLPKAELFRKTRGANGIFGDSRAYYGLTGVPGFINNAYGGDTIADTDAKIRWYYRDRDGFRIIIVVSPDNFVAKAAPTLSGAKVRDIYDLYFFRDDDSAALRPYLASQYYRDRVFLIWRTWLQKGSFVSTFRLTDDGANLTDATMTALSGPAADAARLLAFGEARSLSLAHNPAANELDQLLSWLRSRGATVCVVTPPAFRQQSNAVRASPEYRRFFEGLGAMVATYGFTYRNYFWNDEPVDDFADAWHVNARGAAVFSSRVATDCAVP